MLRTTKPVWLRATELGLVAVCLGLWSLIAIESVGSKSPERCSQSSCPSAIILGSAPSPF